MEKKINIHSIIFILFILVLQLGLFFCLYSCTSKQNGPPEETKEKRKKFFNDGYDWEKLDKDVKIGYLIGIEEGFRVGEFVALLTKTDTNRKNVDKETLGYFKNWFDHYDQFQDVKFTQIIEELDILYYLKENKIIPIYEVIPHIVMRIKGETNKQEMKEKLNELRSVYK